MPSKVVALSRGGLSFKFTCVTNESLKYFVTKNGVETGGLKTKVVDEVIIEVKPRQAFNLCIETHNKNLRGLLRVGIRTSNFVWKTELHTYIHPERKEQLQVLSYDSSVFFAFEESMGFLGLVNLAFKAMPKSSLQELLNYEKKALFWKANNSFTFKLHVPGHLEYGAPLLNASTVSSDTSSESTRPQITSLTFQIPFPMTLSPEPNARVNSPISQSSQRRQRQRRPDIDKRLSSPCRRIENLDSRLSPNIVNVSTRDSNTIERLQNEIKEFRELLERKEKQLKRLLCKIEERFEKLIMLGRGKLFRCKAP